MNKYKEALASITFTMHRRVTPKKIGHCEDENLDILEELVEKATPKKPNLEADGYSNGELVYDTWICPSCGKHYEVDYDDYKYCPDCGQALDWSNK